MNLYLVTGTTRGLGLALVRTLAARDDAEVVAFSRSAQSLPRVRAYQVDLSQPDAVLPVVRTAIAACSLSKYDKVVLLNNAGIVVPVGPLARNEPAQLDANIRTNLLGPLVMMRAFIEVTESLARDRLIVNISSGAGKRPVAGWTAYCASKAGLDMATRVAALEAPAGLTVCSLAPGVVDTPMQAELRQAKVADFPDLARFQAMMAEGTLRPPEEVATTILRCIDQGKLQNGGLHDVREMA